MTGTERVVFTPDLPVSELVFRLWASAPRPTKAGGSSALTSVAVGGAKRVFSRPTPTLVRIPWRGAKGVPVTVDLGFTIRLPQGADDRFGNRGTPPTVRDVAVAVGAFRTVTLPGPVPVLVGVAPQVTGARDATASHEVAHQWFYGLVGDDQARDPWLDEAFATYAEALDRGPEPATDRPSSPPTAWAGPVGR